MHTMTRCHTGDVAIAPTFVVTPLDVATVSESQWLETVGGQSPSPGFDPAARMQEALRGNVPGNVLVAKAIAAVRDTRLWGTRKVEVRNVGPFEQLANVCFGEPLTPVVTVRFHSRCLRGVSHLTLVVQLRGRAGRTAARLELGVEVPGSRAAPGASAPASTAA